METATRTLVIDLEFAANLVSARPTSRKMEGNRARVDIAHLFLVSQATPNIHTSTAAFSRSSKPSH